LTSLFTERLKETASKFSLGQRSLTITGIFLHALYKLQNPERQPVVAHRLMFRLWKAIVSFIRSILILVIDSSFHFTFTPYCSPFSHISFYLAYVIIVDSSLFLLSSLFSTLAHINQRLQSLRNYGVKSELRMYVCVQSKAASMPFESSGHLSDTDILRSICDSSISPRSLPTVCANRCCEQHKSLGYHEQGSTEFKQLPK